MSKEFDKVADEAIELINTVKKKLRGKKKNPAPVARGLSTGSTLLNLACSGKPNVGYLTGGFYYLVGDSASGKAQPLDCKVLTPTGWRKMGNLKVGDKIVDPDGGEGSVVAVHPQGVKKVFRITLSDGSSTRCCENHLWLVENLNDRARGTTRIKTTREVREHLGKKSVWDHLHVPVAEPVEFDSQGVLSVPPYLLGVLLGNGLLRNRDVGFSSVEEEIVERVRSLIPVGHRLSHRSRGFYNIVYKKRERNDLLDALRNLELAGCRASTKFIPKQYLRASLADRMQLLQGLMDTDGYAPKMGSLEYSTVSKRLMRGVRELVRSLGGVASVSRKDAPRYRYKGEIRTGQPCYIVFFSLPEGIIPFTLRRKLERVRIRKFRKSHKIIGVECVGEAECQCITVSTARNLYVTDDYIVTHNSWLTMSALAEAGINPEFKQYRFIHDNAEHGTLMDLRRFFGSAVVERLEPPAGTKESPVYSSTVEEFYYYVDDAFDKGEPFIYLLDSMDALDTEDDDSKFQEDKLAHRKDKKTSGSYGTAKAKKNSSMMRRVFNRLRQEGKSVLIVVSQTRDNIGFGAQRNPKTRGGGRALTFYANLEIWTSIKGHLKVAVPGRGKEVEQGIICQARVKKNRIQGKDRTVEFPILHSHGIDDTGALVDYLVEWKHWEESAKKIHAPEFDFVGKREDLIQKIRSDGGGKELQFLVTQVWDEIEAACAVERDDRYG